MQNGLMRSPQGAPMAGAQDARLALAVSRAGALGSLPAAMLAPEALERELQPLRDDITRAVCQRAFIGDDDLPRNDKDFKEQIKRARSRVARSRSAGWGPVSWHSKIWS